MANSNQIKDYLLGHLPESEQLKLEEEYFADPEALTAFWADSNDLIDAYLTGKLSQSDQLKFGQRLIQLPAIREKVETDRALLQTLGIFPKTIANQSSQRITISPRWSLSQWWAELNFPVAAMAVLIMSLMLGAIWYSLKPKEIQLANREAIHQEAPSPLPEPSVPDNSHVIVPKTSIPHSAPKVTPPSSIKNPPVPVITSFLLSAEIMRGQEMAPILSVAANVTTVRLQLELNSETPEKLRAVLQTDQGVNVKIWDSLPLTSQKSTSVVTLNLPAASLTNASYVIKLSNTVPPQEYRFKIQKTAQ